MKKLIFLSVIFSSLMILSCEDLQDLSISYYTEDEYGILSEQLNLPKTLDDFSVVLPDHLFSEVQNQKIKNGQNALSTLGRVLFYDKELSSTGDVSCASCHKQEFAFADNLDFSKGVNNLKARRNTLSLAAAPNLSASYDNPVQKVAFGWDHLNRESRSQTRAAILSLEEMGNADIDMVIGRLRMNPVYSILTQKAFGTRLIDEFIMMNALDEFMNSISTFESKFDQGLKESPGFTPTIDFKNFTDEENRGKFIFLNHCTSCHSSKQDIQMKESANNGLDLEYSDKGIGTHQGWRKNGFFKIPFLRNIEITAPYMHDGRFGTLEEVVEHYDQGVQPHQNLSIELTLGETMDKTPKTLNLSDKEKQELISFLHTLTDRNLLNVEKYNDPFK